MKDLSNYNAMMAELDQSSGIAPPVPRTFPPLEDEWDPSLMAAAEGLIAAPGVPAAGTSATPAVPDEVDLDDNHRNTPRPHPGCLFGIVGEIARAAAQANKEVNPYAAAMTVITVMAAGMGRGAFLQIGDSRHHARVFALHVGRSGRGRKGTASELMKLIMGAMNERHADVELQSHTGGLSSREGLVLKIHDGYESGKNIIPAIEDKRLMIIESEFSNVLAQTSREGNTLSAALRDAWDGSSIKPAIKTNPVYASHPHINILGHITPTELLEKMKANELSNGFANRFMMIWAEQVGLDPFPSYTRKEVIDGFADRMAAILRFAGADRWVDRDVKRVTFADEARAMYARLYRTELQDRAGGERVAGLLERRAAYLQRLAMLFALCDLSPVMDVRHVEAALHWVRYWSDSVRYIFASARQESEAQKANDAAEKIMAFLTERKEATRTQITVDCFQRRGTKAVIDAAIQELLQANPPQIEVATLPRKSGPGVGTKVYRKTTANCANRANYGSGIDVSADTDTLRTVRTERTEVTQSPVDSYRKASALRDFAPQLAQFAQFAEKENPAKSETGSLSSLSSLSYQGVSEKTVPAGAGDDDDAEVM